jgi:hypothetical protein
MEPSYDAVMGLLLGVSAFLLALAILSYRRSGVYSMLLLTEGLSVHVVFTAILIAISYVTDWLENVGGLAVVIIDVIVLVAVVALGGFGGKTGARPS